MKVLTARNGHQDKNKCKFLTRNGIYYLVGDVTIKDSGGCFKMENGRYSPIDKLVWSDFEGRYIKRALANKGIVSDDKVDYFQGPFYEVVDTDNGCRKVKVHPSVNEEVFALDYKTGQWYIGNNPTRLRDHFMSQRPDKVHIGYPHRDTTGKIYNYSDVPQSIKDRITEGSKEEKKPFKWDQELADALGDLTFGLELETCRSLLPDRYLERCGFTPVYDGSIKGNEYVSIPHAGLNGLRNINGFVEALGKYAKVDHTCSLHIHYGNLNFSKDQLVAFYQLYYQVQREIMNMLPPYKQDFKILAQNDNGRGKDYCKLLRSLNLYGKPIQERYKRIWKFSNDNKDETSESNMLNRTHHRQVDKWNLNSRYYAVNFYNYFFSDSHTIEFRAHSGTVDQHKTIMWLAITIACLQYARKYSNDIITKKQKIDLYDITHDIYPKEFAKEIMKYVEERTEYFNELQDKYDNGLLEEFKNEGFKSSRIKKHPYPIPEYEEEDDYDDEW